MNLEKLKELAEKNELIGVFSGITNADYHAGPGVSNSSQSGLDQSPMHRQHARSNFDSKKKALIEGTILHEYILEPHLIENWIVCSEDITIGTKGYIAQMEKNPGRTIVPEDVKEKLPKIREQIMKLPIMQIAMTDSRGYRELSAWWRCPETGLLCKARPDIFIPELRMIVDLKKTQSAAQHDFARSVADYDYHRQGPYHVDGFNHAMRQSGIKENEMDPGDSVDTWVMVAAEWEEPYGVRAWALGEKSFHLGTAEYRENLEKIAACEQAQEWPGYPLDIGTIEVPGWRFRV